jgi:hypothetical protein
MRASPATLTSISPLLPQFRKGNVLEASDFDLEQAQIDEGAALVILAGDLVHVRTDDPEHRQAPVVDAVHLDAFELAATNQPVRGEEDVFGLEHIPSFPAPASSECARGGYVVHERRDLV